MHFAKEKVEYTWNVICVRAGKAGLDLLLFQEVVVGREGSLKGYKLMTSVSTPVFDKRNHSVSELKC